MMKFRALSSFEDVARNGSKGTCWKQVRMKLVLWGVLNISETVV